MAKQLSIFDLRDQQAQPLFEQLGEVGLEPLSTRELVDNLGQDADPSAPLGSQTSGCQRAKVQAEVEDALHEAYIAAWALYDEGRAAAILLRMCARDPAFEAPDWLRELWALYRDELRAEFHGSADDRETDWSEGREDSDDE